MECSERKSGERVSGRDTIRLAPRAQASFCREPRHPSGIGGLTSQRNGRKHGVQIGNKFRDHGRQMTAGEDIAMRRKKLRYRAWHRGTKEMDLVLGPFADANVERFDAAELDRLEALMNEEDPPLLTWVMGQAEPPDHVDRSFLQYVIDD